MKRTQRFLLGIIATLALFLISQQGRAQTFRDERELEINERFEKIILARFGEGRQIDDSYATDVQKAIERASAYPNALLILEIDSGGGHTVAAREIVSQIRMHRSSENLRIVAWVPAQAYSAAAWIAMSCRGLFIAPDAALGDIQPLIQDYKGYERAPEKIVSPLTEEVRSTCQDNGLDRRYPRLFLEAMVDKDIEIVRVENERLQTVEYMRAEDWAAMTPNERQGLIGNIIGLPSKALTTNGREMLELGFQVKVMKPPVEGLLDLVGTEGAQWEVISFEDAYKKRQGLAWHLIFFVAGVVLIFLELKTPGLGIFGLGALGCFIVFFLLRLGISDVTIWPIGMFLTGAFLIIVEVIFFPGILFPLILGVSMMLYSTWIAVAFPGGTGFPGLPDLSDPEQSRAVMTWGYLLIGSVVGAFVLSMTLGKSIHRLPFFNRMVLFPTPSLHAATNPRSARQAPGTMGWTKVTEGQEGETLTALRPSGVINVAGVKVDAVARGGVIEAGQRVRVIEVSGNRIVVRALESLS